MLKKFLIVTHVAHKKAGDAWYAYGPYVREMNLWSKYIDELLIIAPVSKASVNAADLPYEHKNIHFIQIKQLEFTSFTRAVISFIYLPRIFLRILRSMHIADHIHLRCPGNIGLIGCVAQIFYPYKTKTAKYAGNWDWKSVQPFSYRLQQRLLRNTSVTKNMTALVYGQWPDVTKNIKPFFTASYKDTDKVKVAPRKLNGKIKLIYVGALITSKHPLLSAQACQMLINSGIEAELHFYGEGSERKTLEKFIEEHNLQQSLFIHGNQSGDTIMQAFKDSHFLLFASRSEGWPKAVAEAMWWGCLPITTNVSCVPEMVGYGKRGDLVKASAKAMYEAVKNNLNDPGLYEIKCNSAMQWARLYSLEFFESEIKSLIAT